MLRGIDPLLSPELLAHLAAMGHGDVVAIVDANFPASSTARRLVRLDGVPAPRAFRAIVEVLPIDDFVDTPVARMQVVGAPEEVPDVCREFEAALAEVAPDVRLAGVERFDFYERARNAYVVVQTGELRLYGCILVSKGVIRP